MEFRIYCLAMFFFGIIGCSSVNPQNEASINIEHNSWNELLQQHVDSTGNVNYKGFIADSIKLNQYLNLLASNVPNDNWSEKEKLAFWINFYNAFTVKLIVDHYPLQSIKEIGSMIQIPFVNTPWQKEFIKLGDNYYDLDNIEHDIIREKFNEPRVHFALVCAAKSCPTLRNEAYEAKYLEKQLTDQAITFLNDPRKNMITESELKLSRIFWWFKGDFTKSKTLIEYINQFTSIDIKTNADIDHLDYDWSLNEQ